MFNRYPIPVLGPHTPPRLHLVRLQRSFKSGPRDFFRLYRDEPLDLTVTVLDGGHPRLQVMLHTDLGAAPRGEWTDYPFETTDGKVFRLQLATPRCGLYRFRVRYSLDNGEHWQWDRVPHSFVLIDPPALRTMRLYTLIPSASGTLRDWTDLLPGIAAMGFDALHLLPVTPMGQSQSPYSAANLFALDERYRDPADPRDSLTQFESFVDACARHKLRLCLDLVLNHVAVDSEMATLAPDWLVPDDTEPDGFKRAGCWHMQQWIRWTDLALVNYDHPNPRTLRLIWDYMQQYALFWTNYAAATGGMVRFDNLHSSHPGFISELSTAVRARFPDMTILGEYFTDQFTLEKTVPEWGINLLIGNTWENPFGPQLRHYVQYVHTVSDKLRHLCPITTHDTLTPAQLFGSDRSCLPRYAICALYTAGQTGLVQGVEVGLPERVPFIGPAYRLDMNTGVDFRPFITRINALMADYAVLRRGGNLVFVDQGHAAILGAYRRPATTAENGFLLLANLDTSRAQTVTLDLTQQGLALPLGLTDLLTGDTLMLNDPQPTFEVPSCGVKVYRMG
jgi:starch synthase (maltosyl-transferring)